LIVMCTLWNACSFWATYFDWWFIFNLREQPLLRR
jgi:hypothetical protein